MIEKILNFKNWLLGLKLGVVGIVIWYVIKFLICTFSGICII